MAWIHKRRSKSRIAALWAAAGGALTAGAVHAADRYYVGPDGGSWNNSSLWALSPGGVGGAGIPTGDNVAFVGGDTPIHVNFDAFYPTGAWNGGAVISGTA